MDANIVTISGGRQSGKTHALLDIAAREAESGRKVLWFAHRMREADEAHRLLAERIHPNAIKKIHRVNGQKRITTLTGGEVVFISVNGHAGRGHTADTLIFDDTPVHPDALPCIAGNPDGRVYATTSTRGA